MAENRQGFFSIVTRCDIESLLKCIWDIIKCNFIILWSSISKTIRFTSTTTKQCRTRAMWQTNQCFFPYSQSIHRLHTFNFTFFHIIYFWWLWKWIYVRRGEKVVELTCRAWKIGQMMRKRGWPNVFRLQLILFYTSSPYFNLTFSLIWLLFKF